MRVLVFSVLFFFSFEVFSIDSKSINQSVIEVKVTYQVPNYIRPWQYQNPNLHFSNGVFVSQNKQNFILLPAEEILHSTLIEVKKFSSYQYFSASVVKIDTESNLALLKVQDSNFFKDLKSVEFSDKLDYPQKVKIHFLQDSGLLDSSVGDIPSMVFDVSIFGFVELPVLNLNSSEKLIGKGELVVDDKTNPIGIVYYFDSNENLGKIIPNFIIKKFLSQYQEKDIFAYKGFKFKSLIDKASRDYYGISQKNQGVLVSKIISEKPSKLKLEDVILQVGDFKVDSNGYIQHPKYGKQFFSYLFHIGDQWDFKIGNKIPVQIVRNKKIMDINLDLKPFPYSLIKIHHKNEFKSIPYSVQNGFVFLELSKFFLNSWGGNWRNIFRKFSYLYDTQKFYKINESKNKIIILSQVLPDIANTGYHDLRFQIVRSINGKPVKSIQHLKEEIYKSDSRFKKIRLDSGVVLALDKEKLQEVNQRVFMKYGVKAR